jgi:hypothetical protein
MNLKRIALSILTLSVIISTDIAYAETLCMRIVTESDSPATGAIVSFYNRIATSNQDGLVCFNGVPSGQYRVVINWNDNRNICFVRTSQEIVCRVS